MRLIGSLTQQCVDISGQSLPTKDFPKQREDTCVQVTNFMLRMVVEIQRDVSRPCKDDSDVVIPSRRMRIKAWKWDCVFFLFCLDKSMIKLSLDSKWQFRWRRRLAKRTSRHSRSQVIQNDKLRQVCWWNQHTCCSWNWANFKLNSSIDTYATKTSQKEA